MINSNVCNNCICLPACVSKPYITAIMECTLIRNEIKRLASNMDHHSFSQVRFAISRRNFVLNRAGSFVEIGVKDKESCDTYHVVSCELDEKLQLNNS